MPDTVTVNREALIALVNSYVARQAPGNLVRAGIEIALGLPAGSTAMAPPKS